MHNQGRVKATKYMVAWKIVFKQKYETITKARIIERKIKSFKSELILKDIIRDGVIKCG